MALKIYGNLDRLSLTSGLVQSATNLIARPAPALVAGDSVTVDLFLTGQNGLLNIQDYPTRRLGVGNLNARPTGGTWDLGAQTGLAYDISAASLQAAITSETAANTTTQLTAFVFKVVFTANGAQTIPTVDATALTPSSTVNIARLVTGDASTQEEWLIRIFQNPIALIDSGWTDISGSGIRGSLNLGTEGVYNLLNGSTSASTYLELELTDSSGDISTIFQVPVTINGEVIGQGVTGVATWDSYVTSSQLAAASQRGNMIFVDAVYGDDSSGAVGRADLPFLTCNAALSAASSGDLIIVYPGSYTGESTLAGADGVNWEFKPGADSPSFNVTGAFTFIINGDTKVSFTVNNASADITVYGDVAGPSAQSGSLTIENADGSVGCSGGTLVCKKAGANISCTGGTLTCEEFTQKANCSGGTLNIRNSQFSATDSLFGDPPITLSGSGSLNMYDVNMKSAVSGGALIDISNSWSGNLFLKDTELSNTTVTGNEATIGINYGTSVTGDVQLKDCTIITAESGTGTAKSIDAPSAQTVYVQGSLNVTHAPSATVTHDGGNIIINSAFTA